MLIGELAAAADTTKATIRHYDSLGLSVSRTRRAGSRRYADFHAENLERMRLIRFGQAMGFSLRELAQLLKAYYDGDLSTHEQIAIFEEKLAAIDDRLAALGETRRYLSERLITLRQRCDRNQE